MGCSAFLGHSGAKSRRKEDHQGASVVILADGVVWPGWELVLGEGPFSQALRATR